MIIDLPKEFYFENLPKGQIAFIHNGILKLSKQTSFRKIMIDITYKIKGKRKCYYCGRKVSEEKMTIDHMFPSDFGGPTIPNNLLPACKQCNNEKRNMTRQQYHEFLKSKKDKKGDLYIKELQSNQEDIRERKEYQIPCEWITLKKVEEIVTDMDSLDVDYRYKKYESLEKYYLKYKIIQKPIVVDRKLFVLDGFLELMIAKNYDLESIPVIILENVEVVN